MFGSIVLTAFFMLVIIGIISYVVAIFNGLIQLKNNIKKSWANIDVLLKQRYDELPNLIETVKGYMKHEKTVLTEITIARTAIMTATTKSDKAGINDRLSKNLKTLFAVAENYPKLQASENFLKLQERISALENEIADRREFYNDGINNYNIRIQSIPDTIIARMLKYTEEEMFKATDEEKKTVKVQINS
jgi:LemA protein